MTDCKKSELQKHATSIRLLTLDMISNLGVGHVGGALSIADVLSVLYFDKMNIDPADPGKVDRDRLVLSKGHAGPALYAALALRGYFPKEMVYTLNQPSTNLPSHCDRKRTPGIDMTAGSLGQGFSAAVGIALGQKIHHQDAYTYSIVGDGESQEGQIWEAAMLAGSKKLDNLIAFTDFNGMQIDGTVDEVCTISPLADKWRAFNFNVYEVDGHDVAQIADAIELAKAVKGKPSMIILKTIKGKGAPCAEGKLGSHNMPLTREQYEEALAEFRKEGLA